jgi:serine acetyltransferase
MLVLAVHRLAWAVKVARTEGTGVAFPWRWLAAVARRAATIVAKAHLSHSMHIAPGVWLPDGGHVVLGAVEIGPGTIIHSRVTVGMGVVEGGRPRIGARVWIGSDSIIYGAIAIGDGATILPGTVVTRDVPPGAVISGNPMRLIGARFDNTILRGSLARHPPTRHGMPGLVQNAGRQ